VDLSEVRQLREGFCVSEGDEGDPVVGEGGHRRNSGGFLSTTVTTGGDEHASKLAVQFTLLPEMAGRVPKRLPKEGKYGLSSGMTQKKREGHVLVYLPLRREVAVSGGNAAKEAIIVDQFGGGHDGVAGLGGGVHLVQNLLRESLGDPSSECDQTMCPTMIIVIVLTGRW
jgi:hypothetical protein